MKPESDVVETELNQEQEAHLLTRKSLHDDERKLPPLKSRLGTVSTFLFFGSVLMVLAGMAFLGFLWFADSGNHSWRTITVNNWTVRAVAFTSVGIRWAVGSQTAASLAMLAAFILEKDCVPLPHVAAVSIMRMGGSGVVGAFRDLIIPLISKGPRTKPAMWFHVSAGLGLLITSSLLQFTSTALLSDLSMVSVVDFGVESNVAIDYLYGTGFTTFSEGGERIPVTTYSGYTPHQQTNYIWNGRQPSEYPSFAEYVEPSEPPTEGLVDTGVTIRAFLPFPDAKRRESLSTYQGKAMVFDSRVACVKPIVTNWTYNRAGLYTGMISPSAIPSIVNAAASPIKFACRVPTGRRTLCQLDNSAVSQVRIMPFPLYQGFFSGGLFSAFRKSAKWASGAVYVVISSKVEDGTEWTQATWDQGLTFDWFTLCYAAIDVANRDIVAVGAADRREPAVKLVSDHYDFSEVIKQLLPGSADERGIMRIDQVLGAGWKRLYSGTNGTDGPGSPNGTVNVPPYLVDILNFQPWGFRNSILFGNYSLWMTADSALSYDPLDADSGGYVAAWLGEIYEGVLNQSSTARAIQAVLTTVAARAYYEPIYFNRYNKRANITTWTFQPYLAPAKRYNLTYIGTDMKPRVHYTMVPPFFTTVAAVLLLHHTFVAAIFWSFWRYTRLSRLEDPWQVVAHVALGTEATAILEASTSRDSDRTAADKVMKATGVTKVLVGIATDENRVVTLRRKSQGSSSSVEIVVQFCQSIAHHESYECLVP